MQQKHRAVASDRVGGRKEDEAAPRFTYGRILGRRSIATLNTDDANTREALRCVAGAGRRIALNQQELAVRRWIGGAQRLKARKRIAAKLVVEHRDRQLGSRVGRFFRHTGLLSLLAEIDRAVAPQVFRNARRQFRRVKRVQRTDLNRMARSPLTVALNRNARPLKPG